MPHLRGWQILRLDVEVFRWVVVVWLAERSLGTTSFSLIVLCGVEGMVFFMRRIATMNQPVCLHHTIKIDKMTQWVGGTYSKERPPKITYWLKMFGIRYRSFRGQKISWYPARDIKLEYRLMIFFYWHESINCIWSYYKG